MALTRLLFFGIISCQLLLSYSVSAQKKDKNVTEDGMSIKFGNITAKDFDPSIHAFDSTADAVVLFDKGYSYFQGSNEGWFQLVFEKQQRIKILNKNGMDAANFIISQYKSSKSEERIDKLKAITYNLENGQVVSTKLSDKEIYKDQISRNISHTKFGLPNVKEGSIIEVSYVVTSDFLFNLRSWEFQGRYPRVYSEYATRIPEFFVYVKNIKGYIDLESKSTSNPTSFHMVESDPGISRGRETYRLSANETETKWVARKVPGLKYEPFTTTLENHISQIGFQLAEYRFPNQVPEPVMSTWAKVSEELMKDEEFGASLIKNNGWLDEDVKRITASASNDLEKAKALYTYLRDKFSLTKEGGKYMTDQPKNIWKNMKGNTADANLMLTLMLRHAGLQAYPVLVSTRDNGYANETYPLINEYNYVISKLWLDNKVYFLDATNPMLGFGYLPLDCYNGHARVITQFPTAEYLWADSVRENKTTIINLFSNEEKPFEGEVSSRLGYYESLHLRERLKEEGLEKVTSGIKNALPPEVEMEDLKFENEKNYETWTKVIYKVKLEDMLDEDIIYINPLLGEKTKENPFVAAERKYPVEMPYAFKETILSNIKIPAGYQLDEMPKSARVKLEGDLGQFDYIIQEANGVIQLRTVIDIRKANFEADQYQGLRDFFIYVVKKQSEQIVLKKKES
jgi:hypothetical protein